MLIETIQQLAQRAADVICDLRRHPPDCKIPRSKIIAHRGAWDRQNIENTMPAFERARTLARFRRIAGRASAHGKGVQCRNSNRGNETSLVALHMSAMTQSGHLIAPF